MNKKVLFVGSMLVVALSVFASALDFSADIITTAKGKTMNGKMFMSGEKVRMESSAAGMTTVSIVRPDKKVVWILMPPKTYMEQSLKPEKMVGMSQKTPGEMSRKKIGSETINNIKCDKYEVTYKSADKTQKMFQWISGDNWPVKSAAADGSWSSEFRNIKKGSQAANLFEIPAGYSKMSFSPAGMKGMNPSDMKSLMNKYKGMGK